MDQTFPLPRWEKRIPCCGTRFWSFRMDSDHPRPPSPIRKIRNTRGTAPAPPSRNASPPGRCREASFDGWAHGAPVREYLYRTADHIHPNGAGAAHGGENSLVPTATNQYHYRRQRDHVRTGAACLTIPGADPAGIPTRRYDSDRVGPQAGLHPCPCDQCGRTHKENPGEVATAATTFAEHESNYSPNKRSRQDSARDHPANR